MQGSKTQQYWDSRYQQGLTGWDLGSVSPPIAQFLEGIQDPHTSILIPGAGNAYEAYFLHKKGFRNITVVDIAPTIIASHQRKVKQEALEGIHFIEADFFSHMGTYDLILEQTFFCAIPINQRSEYVKAMHALLSPSGRLAGVLFDCEFEQPGPPFGGSETEYRNLFEPYFNITTMEPCYNSIQARSGRELFIIITPKKIKTL